MRAGKRPAAGIKQGYKQISWPRRPREGYPNQSTLSHAAFHIAYTRHLTHLQLCTDPPYLADDERAVALHLDAAAAQLQGSSQARNEPRILSLIVGVVVTHVLAHARHLQRGTGRGWAQWWDMLVRVGRLVGNLEEQAGRGRGGSG